MPVITVEPFDTNEFAIRTPYNETIVKMIRGVPGSWWDKKNAIWHLPMSALTQTVRALSSIPLQFKGIEMPKEMVQDHRPTADLAHIEGYEFKTVPYEHQKTAMALGIEKKRFAYLMEMGTGKTKSVIDVLTWFKTHGFIKGAFIIAPKAMIYTWQREFETHSPLHQDERVCIVLTGSTIQKRRVLELYKHTAHFFITNYESLLSIGDDLCKFASTQPMACVLDESTRIKNHASQTAKATHKLGFFCPYRYIMTGTPITQGPLDAFSQFKFLDETILGHHNYYSFKAEYSISGGFKGKEVIGYKNLERLQQRIAPHSYRVLKVECLDLPEKIYQVIEVDLGEEQRAIYRAMREEGLVELDGKFAPAPVILTKLLRLQQITSGFLPLYDDTGKEVARKEVDSPKHDAVEDLVDSAVNSNQKVIIWCRFLYDIEKLGKRLEEYGVVLYYGDVNEADRQSAIDRFQTDPGVRIFIGQIQTGGMGITLTAASTEIYVSNTFTLADRLQSEDRAHRIGQKNNVNIIDVVCRKTVDDFILKTLNNKKNLADVITGDSLREAAGDA